MKLRFLLILVALLIMGTLSAFAEKSVKEIQQLAEQGNAEAQAELAVRCEQGRGVPKDFNEALKWYQKAAEGSNSFAETTLGWFYQNGQGVKKDPQAAVSLYLGAAKQGNATAQGNLAVMYDEGIDIPENKPEALKWYRKASMGGNPRAELNLAVMYWMGQVVKQDYQQAWVLLNRVRTTSRDKQAQWAARHALDAIKEELGVDRRIGRFDYPDWDVVKNSRTTK
jgi:TPR repeat protein